MANPFLKKLSGGDRRSIGRSREVVAEVLSRPALFGRLFEALQADDPVVRLRAADAVEKITAQHPEYLQPYRREILHRLTRTGQMEVRWHVAQLIPRLSLTRSERALAVVILIGYLSDRSSIVKTFAMQALADLARKDADLRAQVLPIIEALTETGTAAMRARGRMLMKQLRNAGRNA